MKISAYHPFRSQEAKAEYLSLYDDSEKDWAVPSECQMIDTAYGQTFVRISGPRNAPSLVLFPGAGTTSLMWSLNIKDLAENYRTYAIDSLIHTGSVGRSIYTRPITGANDANKWLDELFNNIGLTDEINFVGPSYGGWLASQYALHNPNRLSKMVLVAPAGTILPFSGAYISQIMFLNILPMRFNYRRFFRWSFPDLAQMNEQFIEAMIDEFLVSKRCFVPPNFKELPKLTAMTDEELQKIDVPTLVLIGENEVLYSAQDAMERLDDIAPKVQKELIPNAGHDLLLVQMELVNQKILEFLGQDKKISC